MTDKIPGGLASGKSLVDIAIHHGDPSWASIQFELFEKQLEKQLEKGIKIEMEHTSDESIAREIAMDHLWEDPKYYGKLEKIEEIKIQKPDIVFKVTIPKEWEEKLVKTEDKLKCYEDIVANNTKFFDYLSSSVGEDIISYVRSLLEGEQQQINDQTITSFIFDIFVEAIYYYLVKLNFYYFEAWSDINNLIVKQFDKRLINLTQIEQFAKKKDVSEIKIEKPIPSIDPIPLHLKYSIIPELKILLEYTNQDILNPNVFEVTNIKPKVREVLLKIANYFWDSLELNQEYQDVLFYGKNH
jgi:hypothetical protein